MNLISPSTKVLGLAVLGGAVLGAGAALLLAPQSGKETRRKLGKFGKRSLATGKEISEKVMDTVSTAKRKGAKLMQKGLSFVESVEHRIPVLANHTRRQ